MLKLSLGTSLVLATIATTLVASPSFAATRHHARAATVANESYAAAPAYGYAGSQVVVVDGRVVGADPDANVRLQLLKDAETPNE